MTASSAPHVIVIDTPGLGDRGYIAHDGVHAFVIDPQRDTDRVERLIAEHGLTVTHVGETHIHNDYVNGGYQFAKKHGISDQTIYGWRKRYGTLQTADVKRLRQLEVENARLKKLVADRDLELDVLREISRKKW